jgi:transcriptional regulator with XRE-family HTH domain
MPVPKTSPNRALGDFLRTRRAAYGLTQEEMAAKISEGGYPVSGESLSRWEITGAIPALRDPQHSRVLARAYGVTPAHLLSLGGYLDFLPSGELDAILKKLPARLLNLLDQASPDQLELITRVVAAILAEEE